MGYPPLLIQVRNTGLLRDEAIRTALQTREAGIDAELELWPAAP
jgi:acetyl esterase/lipase